VLDSSKPTTPIPSVDSAMESWDSGGHEVNGGFPVTGHSGAMLVAVPQCQSNRLSVASSSHHRTSRHSTFMDGSAEGLTEGGLALMKICRI
jgi:hypothetical protein